MATIPLSPVIFAIMYYFAYQIDPTESEVDRCAPGEFRAAKQRMAVNIMALIALAIGLHRVLLSPTPAENELRRLDGRLIALNWNRSNGFKFRVSVQEDPQNRPGNHPIRFEFRSALIQSADLIARLERDRPSLVGQRAVVGYYPNSKDIFTLQIAGVDYRTYQQGQTAHGWWRLEGLAVALAALCP